MKYKTIIEPFRVKMVESIRMTTEKERQKFLKEAKHNLFLLKAEDVIIDLLTDSGIAAMSSKQWAGMMIGDESYAGAKSWKKMEATIKDLTGYRHVLPTHQGRAAERILYGRMGGKGKTFISNTHFDTTRANIEFSNAEAIDCPTEIGKKPSAKHPFKGNMNVSKLTSTIKERGQENVAAVILTVTNNSGGGQPVSMKNAKKVSEVCKKHNIPLIIDACRIAENSYFIKQREKAYKNNTYKEIAQKMFALADGCTMSAKKDGIVNMGGFLALNNHKLTEQCKNELIITEGFITYGGISGRDMEAIAVGLEEVFDPDYLQYRIASTTYLGERLDQMGIPIMLPVGGHAVYIDAKSLYSHIPVDQYPGQSLVCNLYLKGGIRSSEIGSVMFGKKGENQELIPAPMELVRLAIPRRVYTQSHIDYVIEVFEQIKKEKKKAKGIKIVKEPKYLRHFTSHFKFV
jgi:tryptophanase